MHTKRFLTSWTIAMINVAAVCNIKNFPLMAEYGLSIITFLLLSSVIFFIPVSLVAAELATGWPERGIYTWVKAGLGPRLGFLAIWLQWIANVIWYPTVLSFTASTFAYLFMPELAQNKTYVLSVIIIAFWSATFINFLGMRVSGWISSLTALFGTILPVSLIIVLSIIWIVSGHPLQIEFTWKAVLPDLASFKQLSLFAGILLGLTGMEMSAVHAKDVEQPKKDYPKAILLSAILVILLSAIGSLAIAAIVPISELELTSGGMEAFSYLFTAFGMPWAIPVIAAIMTLGALGMISTWIVGPSRGLFATALDGDLPPLLHRTNKHGMPVVIFIIQALIVTALCMVFLYMPTVGSSFWILVALASQLNMIMYILMFISAIRLRYTKPDVVRAYHVPGGRPGIWIVSLLGMTGPLFGIGIALFPPSQLDTGSLVTYESILLGGMILFCVIPMVIFSARKASWLKSG
jgi:putative glutamate/gamma-aminobutyrate antiporter